MSSEQSKADLLAENQRLKKINQALVTRVEAGHNASQAYDSFAHSIFLADQVRQRTAALENAVQSKAKLLAAIGHDLMQPIAAAKLITGSLFAALPPRADNQASRQRLNAIEGAMGDMEQLLTTLLDHAKLEACDLVPDTAPFCAATLLDNLTVESCQLASSKGLTCRISRSRCLLQGDLKLITRVLRNFISNAIRYTSQGRILVGGRRRANGLQIQVLDTGCGIPTDKQSSIFDEFSQLQASSQGLGLGLSNVKKLCHAMQLPLQLASIPGQGSCFSVTIPYATQSQAATEPLPEAMLWLQHKRILLVENDASIRQALVDLLTSWRANVYTASNIADMAVVPIQTMDLLIVDYHLDNQITGLDALASIAAADKPLPVLMITANRDQDLAVSIQQAGHELLYKPVKPAKLRRLLHHMLGKTCNIP
jgi:signal transduction histidine kinase/CheY-like chemotaxis protein